MGKTLTSAARPRITRRINSILLNKGQQQIPKYFHLIFSFFFSDAQRRWTAFCYAGICVSAFVDALNRLSNSQEVFEITLISFDLRCAKAVGRYFSRWHWYLRSQLGPAKTTMSSNPSGICESVSKNCAKQRFHCVTCVRNARHPHTHIFANGKS